MPEAKEKFCRFNTAINCDPEANIKCCATCGWNPFADNLRRKGKLIPALSEERKLLERVGLELANIRDVWGITSEQLARRTSPKVPSKRILEIETAEGEPIKLIEFAAIAQALEITADRLLGWE